MHMHPDAPGRLQRLMARVTVGMAACLALAGCAELMLVNSTVVLAQAMVPGPVSRDEIGTETLRYPAAEVWSALTRTVEHDGRKVASRDDETLTLQVAYPFSWMRNNWGGVLTITCEPVPLDAAGPATVVRVVGDARDATVRVRKIGDEIFGRLHQQLGRDGAPPT